MSFICNREKIDL